jgi:Xaa-Pro aminopeptidase
MASHRIAARNLIEIKTKAFALIRDSLDAGKKITEWDVCAYMLKLFEQTDMETDAGPNCSIGANAGNPHYEPTPEQSETIQRDQLVLLDIWAKLKTDKAVYADITWMGFAGTKSAIPAEYNTRFNVIRDARDRAVAYLRENYGKHPVYGYDVDDATRKVIVDANLGQYFTHRTGHSIHVATHGPGPNIDNLETEDRRLLQPGHLFSIEPGVYFVDCGFRTEIDVLIGHDGIEVTTLPLQTEITALF